MKRPVAIDLFAGCGGLTVGLKQAGFDVRVAVDIDALAVETYRKNHPSTVVLQQDLSAINVPGMLKRAKLKKHSVDLIAGCPPCQGFSSLRTLNGGKKINEPMNDLVFQFLRVVEEIMPRAVMLENVPGLHTDPRLKRVVDRLEALGFECKAEVFDACEFGVPQRRRRMILIGARGFVPAFAKRSHVKATVRSVIESIPKPGKSGDPLHDYPVKRAERIIKLIKRIPKDGGSRSSLPPKEQLRCHKDTRGFYDIYGRMAWDKPSPTITGGCINPSKGRYLHPQQDRAITLREAALLQGFARSYQFSLNRGRYPAAQMIGNAFPPGLAKRHALALRRGLKSARQPSRGV